MLTLAFITMFDWLNDVPNLCHNAFPISTNSNQVYSQSSWIKYIKAIVLSDFTNVKAERAHLRYFFMQCQPCSVRT